MRESMAVGLEYREQRRYDGIVKLTDVISRIAPMVGLLGTLIPLGPGIMALGKGDLNTLGEALLTAFNTTSLGLIVGGMALIISAIRTRWYNGYMVNFDAAIECVLEVESLNPSPRIVRTKPAAADEPAIEAGAKFKPAPASEVAATPEVAPVPEGAAAPEVAPMSEVAPAPSVETGPIITDVKKSKSKAKGKKA
jgi:hypothetical protein